MPEYNELPELRSDEVQEIMARTPNWMPRWGLTSIFIVMLGGILLCWLIKYPDKIPGTLTVTTKKPPVSLIVRSSGEIEFLGTTDNQFVRAGTVLATVRSSLKEQDVADLKSYMYEVRKHLRTNDLEHFQIKRSKDVYGEMEGTLQLLNHSIEQYQQLTRGNQPAFMINNLTKQLNNQRQLLSLTEKQVRSQKHLIDNAEQRFNSDKSLYEKGVISQSEYYDREKIYQQTVGELQSLEKTKIQIAITITELEKQLFDQKYNFENQKMNLYRDIETQLKLLENSLAGWKRIYQVTSPINGKLTYLQTINRHQFIAQGTELFAVVPENQDYVVHMTIAKEGFGKVKKGQKVNIRLDKYPANEYGQLQGEVSSISLLSQKEGYRVTVKLPKGMMSTYDKELKYSPNMSGNAEIITEELRITDRIFNKFKKAID